MRKGRGVQSEKESEAHVGSDAGIKFGKQGKWDRSREPDPPRRSGRSLTAQRLNRVSVVWKGTGRRRARLLEVISVGWRATV